MVAACVAACFAHAAPAFAGTVSINGPALQFDAGPNETNSVTVSRSGDSLLVRDTTAPIDTTAPGCSDGGDTITCPVAGISDFEGDGGNMNDTLTLNAALEGELTGGSEDDTVTGGPLDDGLGGEAGVDTLNGGDGEGRDRLFGGAGNDTLNGGAGDDNLDGQDDNDVENGGEGNDSFDSRFDPGADAFNGGPGDFDSVSWFDTARPVNVTLDGVPNDGRAGEGDNVGTDIEVVSGSDVDDVILGNHAANILGGGEGNDTVTAFGGRDLVDGDEGNDILDGGEGEDEVAGDPGSDSVAGGGGDDRLFDGGVDGADAVSGGTGTDFIRYARSNAVTLTLDDAPGDGEAGEGDNVGADIENVTAGDGDDVLSGTDASNFLDGQGGNDAIAGRGGNDALVGGPGDDGLDGGLGNDSLSGDSGNDRLHVRDGLADEAACGSGDDIVLLDPLDGGDAGCEGQSAGALVAARRVRPNRRGRVRIRLSCPAVEGEACTGTLTLRDGAGRRIGRRAFSVAAGATANASVRLNRSARRRLRRRNLRATAVLAGRDSTGGPTGSRAPLILRRTR